MDGRRAQEGKRLPAFSPSVRRPNLALTTAMAQDKISPAVAHSGLLMPDSAHECGPRTPA